jgi:hypothetical protein
MAAEQLASNPGFGALPNELVMAIIDCMPIENAKDIRSLSLTSRRMYMLSLDHLYNHVLVSCPWPLTRTLLHDPKLAARVHQITWNLNTAENDSNENRKMLSRLIRSFEPVGVKSSTNHKRLTTTWRDHEFMSFFITVTPAIETLIIKDTYGWRDNIYWFGKAVGETGALQHLRSVHIHGPLCIEQIAHLFLVRSLRNVTIIDLVQLERQNHDYVEWNDEIPLYTVLERGVSGVENIILKRACVETLTLAHFTEACRQLKSFAYEHDVHNDLRSLRSPALISKFESLASALAHNRTSLERLSVRGDHQMLYQKHMLQVARLASRMSNLRSLDMGLVTHDDDPDQCTPDFVAHLVRYLPPTLEELTFEMDWQEHWGSKGWEGPTEMLRYLADIAPARLPLLKRVAVVDWPPKLGHFPPDFAMLYQCFAEHNIHFASIPVKIQGPDPLRVSDFVEPGWVFVEFTDVEWRY